MNPTPDSSVSVEPKPRVSVVVPTHNRREATARCLESLRCQTFEDFELVVVDDGSTDSTAEMLASFVKANPQLRVRLVRHPRNRGSNASRNSGVRAAAGEIIAFTDSDCLPEPEWLDRLIAGFDGDRIGSVAGDVYNTPPENIYELTMKGTELVHGAREAGRIVSCNLAVPKRLLEEFPLDEDLTYGCDEEGLFLRLRAAGYRQLRAPRAVVMHHHAHDRKSFFRYARTAGIASAWLVYKFRLPPRLDLLPFLLMWSSMPLGLFDSRLLLVPAAFLAGGCLALLYNELFRKRKTIGETLRSFLLLLAYYQVRTFAYARESLRLRLFPNAIVREHLDAIPRQNLADEARES